LCFSSFFGRDLERFQYVPKTAKAIFHTKQVAEKSHGARESDTRHQFRGGRWLLGLNDAVAAKTARSSPQRVERSCNCRVIGDQSVQYPKESNRDMNLDNENARPGRFPDATDAPSTPLDDRKIGKTRFGFGTTDFVIYPAHGVGQILAIEEQTVAGASTEFFVIFFTKSKLTVRVPVRKAANIGMRKPSDISSVQGVKKILSETPRKGRGNWSRLAQEYESKINSGDIFAVAEVARDLFRLGESEQSFSERQLYVSALDRLCGEIALVDGISTEHAVKEAEGLLKIGTSKRSA
jgi:CarD family transcriptional regulator